MTDKAKWKSVMIQVSTHEKIKDLAHLQKLPINNVLEGLVDQAWERFFGAPVKPSPYLAPKTEGVFRSKA